MTDRLVVGMTGASGSAYGIRLLEELRVLGIESHLVMSKAAELTLAFESDLTPRDVRAKADVNHAVTNVAASIASGSFRTRGMIIAPCSVRTLGEIATGATTSLLTRAADVTLKERRPLVILLRESPLSLIHIRNMEQVTLAGATVCLPAPAFYNRPQTVEDIIDDGVGRLLDRFDIESSLITRWTEGAE
jgi:4-hydroxy-3-polyprenylbenzoate decarboxylase